ncbi:MAG: lipid A export permease/ATP-binding protein MsbA [Pseudomonadota bacterium]
MTASPTVDPKNRRLFHRLMSYVWPHRGRFSIAIAGMLVFAATEPAFAAMMRPLLDGSFVKRDPELIRTMPLILIALFLVRGISGFINSYFLKWVGRRVVTDLRQEMFDRLLHLPTRYFDRTTAGQLLAKFTYNVENVARASTDVLTVVVRDGFTIAGLLAYMIYIDAALAAIFLVVGPTMGTFVRYASRRFRKISKRIQESVGAISHVAQEAIDGHRVVKAYGGQPYEAARFREANELTNRLQMRMVVTESISVPLVQLITALAISLIVYLSTLDAMTKEITVGTFMSFIVAMGMLLSPVKRLTSINSTLQKGLTAAESVFDLMDSETERDQGTHTLTRAQGRVEFRGVGHRYSSNKRWVVQEVSFTVEPGQTLALVGRSGSGKTTLVSLLMRFYDASAGQIFIDGVDIRSLALASLRAQLALVSQDVVLFNDSIAHNITYGRIGATPEEIRQAAESAQALAFIEAHPQGFETLIGDRGVLLSGGQRQRLAIARAMLKDAPILILDEATSSLDSQAERHIQDALETLMAHRTTLVIAHRLSTVEKADRILVLDEGRIIEQGTHQALLAQEGLYAALYRLQFREATPV